MSRRPLTRFYQVRPPQSTEWARLWLTNDGCLTILSDYGNYGYWWSNAGGEIREFLVECDEDYVSRKLADGEREFDGPATVRLIREHIVQGRRSGGSSRLTRERARAEWELVERYATMDHTREFEAWAEKTWYFRDDVGEMAMYSVPGQLQQFMKRIWPLFVQQLTAELAAEQQPVPSPIVGGEWIGVDLDKTLAEYRGEKQALSIGPPVPKMLALVKDWIAQGEDVRIFTARVDGGLVALASGEPAGERYRDIPAIRAAIEAWCLEHVGKVLPITNVKDYGMKALYDDKAIQVEPNTGRLIREVAPS